eukprot:751911-Hanusia_phi.AAC.1
MEKLRKESMEKKEKEERALAEAAQALTGAAQFFTHQGNAMAAGMSMDHAAPNPRAHPMAMCMPYAGAGKVSGTCLFQSGGIDVSRTHEMALAWLLADGRPSPDAHDGTYSTCTSGEVDQVKRGGVWLNLEKVPMRPPFGSHPPPPNMPPPPYGAPGAMHSVPGGFQVKACPGVQTLAGNDNSSCCRMEDLWGCSRLRRTSLACSNRCNVPIATEWLISPADSTPRHARAPERQPRSSCECVVCSAVLNEEQGRGRGYFPPGGRGFPPPYTDRRW